MRHSRVLSATSVALVVLGWSVSSRGDPPTPSGPHPRLFMSASNLAGFTSNAAISTSAAATLVASCQDTIDNPSDYSTRGGSDGDYWPHAAMACAFSYLATHNAAHLTQALEYWNASLNDDQSLGDNLGCVAGVDTNWQAWDGSPPAPPVILTVTHDTGYPIRWYGPYVALAYDWLFSAPGVDAALLAQTRTCLGSWVDWYTASGYHNTEPGSNYNAGYVAAKAFAAIAIGTDGGADGHLWTETLDAVFQTLLVGQGLAGVNGAVGTPAGAMAGGDWGEGWEYGPLSVAEYAASTRALEDNGVALPEMDAWVDSLSVRYQYGTVPKLDGQFPGGDFDSTDVYAPPAANLVDAVLLGPSTDAAASWAKFMQQTQMIQPAGYFWDALAELRSVAPQDFRAQSPAPALWYVARGTRAMYVRTAWDEDAFWGVFTSAPQINSDHHHPDTANFAFSRGGDHLIVDPSTYGDRGTLPTNAVTADSPGVAGDYAPSQTPWNASELVWARATSPAVYAARSDFANAFIFSSNPSDIPYAHREWVFLPEGEIVAIDRVVTADASHFMYLGFHANTAGTLSLSGSDATGTVGSSKVVIHGVELSGATPVITSPTVGDCFSTPAFGACTAVRFQVDEYTAKVPGPNALAIHVVDGIGATESPATVASMTDATIDPTHANAGVVGAAVTRNGVVSYVVASSAPMGASGATMTYSVPGATPARHVVYDAPESSNGESSVTAAAQAGACVLTITAGSGFTGHPLMFGMASAGGGCTVTDGTALPPNTGGGPDAGTGGGDGGGVGSGADASGGGGGANDGGANGAAPTSGGGCGCHLGEPAGPLGLAALGAGIVAIAIRRRRR